MINSIFRFQKETKDETTTMYGNCVFKTCKSYEPMEPLEQNVEKPRVASMYEEHMDNAYSPYNQNSLFRHALE